MATIHDSQLTPRPVLLQRTHAAYINISVMAGCYKNSSVWAYGPGQGVARRGGWVGEWVGGSGYSIYFYAVRQSVMQAEVQQQA